MIPRLLMTGWTVLSAWNFFVALMFIDKGVEWMGPALLCVGCTFMGYLNWKEIREHQRKGR